MMKIYTNNKKLGSRNVNDYIFENVDIKRPIYVHICIGNMGIIEEVVQTIKL